MLYCPKCQQTYKEGIQRFCTNDGERLTYAPSADKSVNRTSGVFSGILGLAAQGDGKILIVPPSSGFVENEPTSDEFSDLSAPETSKIFETEFTPDFIPAIENKRVEQKPLPRVIKPEEIPSSQASLGDRKTNPTGRLALTWENPDALLGQTVKGRYLVVEKLGEDEASIAYLAEDKIVAGKKVLVRVLMDEAEADDFTNKIYAEERVSLSLVNHPNIARILDSGELLEGMPFIVSEYTAGESVEQMLKKSGQFNALRTARIIRQTADALSEAHRNGILHRNLKPENIILTVTDSGAEQVKLINFGSSKGRLSGKNIAYKSPEQLKGKPANFASDIYSLAVIAYRMLTNRLPFNSSSIDDLIQSQREGLAIYPTNLRLDLPPSVDRILEKALAFNPSERYPKARDFGDAFSNALTTPQVNGEEIKFEEDENEIFLPPLPLSAKEDAAQAENSGFENFAAPKSKVISPVAEKKAVTSFNKGDLEAAGLPQRQRLPEQPKTPNYRFILFLIIGGLLLLSGIWAFWRYFAYSSAQPETIQAPVESVFTAESPEIIVTPAPTPEEVESPPLSRSITPPPNTIYFQNDKSNLKGDLAKNFLGFSLYYPKNWKQNDAKGKFLDISKDAPTGTPIEQMLVSYYDSKGTFKADTQLFPSLVKETNSTLKEIVPNYKVVSEGEKTVNNGWRAYEVKFKGSGRTPKGENITLYGRRLFIPAARPGMKNGYVITMLATSLSPDVKSVDDVGVKGELSEILGSFEPNQNF